ncbi:MAG: hypothetical protein H0X31_00070 [Nostocaceae cyanobacterium]|nr:hypothetical protein [Nostocaceae cyanobacterium]
MTDSARITAIETRMDELVEEVANLKIQTSVIGTMQVAISANLTLSTGLATDIKEVKADIREMKADLRNLNAGVDELLRLFRSRGDQ